MTSERRGVHGQGRETIWLLLGASEVRFCCCELAESLKQHDVVSAIQATCEALYYLRLFN
jgi:hypothetical protein